MTGSRAFLIACVLLAGCGSSGGTKRQSAAGGQAGEDSEGGAGGTDVAGRGGRAGTGGAGGTGEAMGGAGGDAGNGGTGGSEPDAAVDMPADASPSHDFATSGDVTLGTLPPGDKHVVVLHGTSTAGDPLRASLMSVLVAMHDSHGVIYEEMIDKQTMASQLTGKALVIVAGNSDFCESTQDPAYGDLPVPVIVSKDCDRTTMIFKLGTMHNTPNDQTKIQIVNPTHPLAAGLMGTVTVFPSVSRIVNASDLGPEAVVIATTMSSTTPGNSPTIFYYPKGAAMLGGFKAPAKRMGFFWHRPTVATDDGKRLVHAAVDWMLRQ